MKKATKKKKKKKLNYSVKKGHYYAPNDATYKEVKGISLKRKAICKRIICKVKDHPLFG